METARAVARGMQRGKRDNERAGNSKHSHRNIEEVAFIVEMDRLDCCWPGG